MLRGLRHITLVFDAGNAAEEVLAGYWAWQCNGRTAEGFESHTKVVKVNGWT